MIGSRYIAVALLSLMSIPRHSKAQTRVTFNALGGFSYALTSISPGYGESILFSLTYVTPINFLSVSPGYGFGELRGDGKISNTAMVDESRFFKDEYIYHTSFSTYGIGANINIPKLVSSKSRARHWIPYLVFGFDYLNMNSVSERLENPAYNRDYHIVLYTDYVGRLIRVKLTQTLDFLFLAKYCRSQSFYLDALPVKDRYDNFISAFVGLSFKPGLDRYGKKEFIDWSRTPRLKVRCPRFY